MSNTVIQLKYSTANAAPALLNIGEPAYSYVSNTLFIGNAGSDSAIIIGGKEYIDRINAVFTLANTTNATLANVSTLIQPAYDKANAANILAQSGFDKANLANTLAQSGFDKANSANVLAQAAFDAANTKFASSGGTVSGDVTVSGNLTILGNTVYANTETVLIKDNIITLNAAISQSGSPVSNAGIEIDRGSSANASLLWDETGDRWVYSSDGATFYGIADAARLDAAFIAANNAGTSANNVYGNTVVLGSNTTGLLVSNAVTLTTATKVTDGLAQINQILGKLVPQSPGAFPNSTSLSVSTLSTYRMTNFTQTDNTLTGGKSVAGGSTVTSVRRAATYTTNTFDNVGPGESGTLTLVKNNVATGAVTFTASSANGTYSDLIITDSKDYALTGVISYTNFWRSFDAQGSGTVANGWNEIYLSHSGGSNTSTVSWYYDNSAPGSPTFATPTIVPLSTTVIYSSTVPHYTSATTFRLGVNVSKLSGDMFPTSNTFFTGTAGGAFGAPTSNTYPLVGITYPLARNYLVSSGSIVVNSTSTIIASFGSSATGPSVTVDNSYSTASQAFTTALANTILYKTGTASAMEETTVTFGSTVGTGSGLAARIINPGTTDTPAYTASAALFNSQSSTLTANDATIVAATLKHDQTNYSTGYLPVGPNLSTGRTGAQYFTFRFVRTAVSKFDIQFTGTIAGMWVALPGSAIDTAAAATNGWIDMSLAYGGSGVPSSGASVGGVVTLNSAVTNHRKTCTFGTVSSSSTSTNEIYVRIKLTSGQTVTALTLQSASN
jgi:hypothetical protein